MLRDYELMYIVRPELDEDALQATVDSVKQLIETQGGEVVKTTSWGKRRLAYEVKHLRDGYYVIVRLRLEGANVPNIERNLRIHDTVFRHMLVVDDLPHSADDTDAAVEAAAERARQAAEAAAAAAPAPPAATVSEPALTEVAGEEIIDTEDHMLEPVGAGVDDEEN